MTERGARVLIPAAMVVACGIIIGLLTLRPGPVAMALSPWCIVCAETAAADALLNVALFLPLGAALTFAMRRAAAVVFTGLAVSITIELLQFAIPGRAGNIGDVLTNTVGTLLGVMVGHSVSAWFRPRPATRRGLVAAAAAAVLGVTIAVPALLQPALPASTWFVQWDAELGHLARYDGRVLHARLGAENLGPGRTPDSRTLRSQLLSGLPLHLRFVTGSRPGRLAPIFSIYDDVQREILLVGARRDDLVIRYRTTGQALRFAGTELLIENALAEIAAGDTARLVVRLQHPIASIELNGRSYRTGPTIADGVVLLLGSDQPSGRSLPVRVLCLAALFFPLGFWADRRLSALLPAAGCFALVLLAPALLPIRQMPLALILAPPAAIVLGLWSSFRVRSRGPHLPDPLPPIGRCG